MHEARVRTRRSFFAINRGCPLEEEDEEDEDEEIQWPKRHNNKDSKNKNKQVGSKGLAHGLVCGWCVLVGSYVFGQINADCGIFVAVVTAEIGFAVVFGIVAIVIIVRRTFRRRRRKRVVRWRDVQGREIVQIGQGRQWRSKERVLLFSGLVLSFR